MSYTPTETLPRLSASETPTVYAPPETLSRQYLLPPVSRWLVTAGCSLVGSFFFLLALSAVVKYPVKVVAPAVVRPDGETKLVQSAVDCDCADNSRSRSDFCKQRRCTFNARFYKSTKSKRAIGDRLTK